MAVEEEDMNERAVWNATSRYWYSKASDIDQRVGRLYHHLAILTGSDCVQGLFYYVKSLCVEKPFDAARDSILTIFQPVCSSPEPVFGLEPVEAALIKVHGAIFGPQSGEQLKRPMREFLDKLDDWIGRRSWTKPGCRVAVTHSCAMLEYGQERSAMRQYIRRKARQIRGAEREASPEDCAAAPTASFRNAQALATKTDGVVLRRIGDVGIMAYIHVRLAFMLFVVDIPEAVEHLEASFPWTLLTDQLNHLMGHYKAYDRLQYGTLPRQPGSQPLPEDWDLRGLLWTEGLFPDGWFDDSLELDERSSEQPSMTYERSERVLWLGRRLASYERWIFYDPVAHEFRVATEHDVDDDRTAEQQLAAEERARGARGQGSDASRRSS